MIAMMIEDTKQEHSKGKRMKRGTKIMNQDNPGAKRSRRWFLTAMGSAALGGALSLARATRAAKSGKPNIVVIIADDLGWNDVSYHGGPIPTPNLDRFVAESVELDRFYVCPVCSPTRSGLMTGRYPQRFGMHGGPLQFSGTKGLPPSEVTLAEMLRDAGYERRMAIGKWHLGNSTVQFHPLRQGFTGFYGHYCGMIGYFGPKRGGEHDWHRDYTSVVEEGYSTDLITNEATRFIGEHADARAPFFLYVSYNAVHTPIQAKESDIEAVAPAYQKARERYSMDVGTDSLPNRVKRPKGNNVASDRPKMRWKDGWGGGLARGQTFFAMTRSMDQGIGKILEAIDRKGLREDTLVWFTSDNGGTSNNYPLRGRKGRRWEGGVRVPAAVRWPRRFEGERKLKEMLAYIDIFPTLAAAAGFQGSSKKHIDGVNALDIIAGKTKAPDRTFYLGRDTVATKRWKLIEGELYDLIDDHREKKNVADQHPKIVAQLTKELERFEALSGPSCRPVNKEKQEAPKDWTMPDIEIIDPNVP